VGCRNVAWGLLVRDPEKARFAAARGCRVPGAYDGGVDACLAEVNQGIDAVKDAKQGCEEQRLGACRRLGELVDPMTNGRPFFERECVARGLVLEDGGASGCVESMRDIAQCDDKGTKIGAFSLNEKGSARNCEGQGFVIPHESPRTSDPERPTLKGPVTIAAISTGLPRAAAEAVLTRARASFLSCTDKGEKFLSFEPVRIALIVDRFGEVPIARIVAAPRADTRILACFRGVAGSLRFPNPTTVPAEIDVNLAPANMTALASP
jgi:hypothetical protein